MNFDQKTIQKRNFWFKNVFFPLTKDAPTYLTVFIKAAKKIYDVIINLKFENVDKEFQILSGITKLGDVDVAATPERLAEYIASIYQEKQLYFDDYTAPKYTSYEIEAFKNTILGKALVDFECFVSQDPKLAVPVQQPHAAPRTQRQSSSTGSLGKPKLDLANGLVNKTKIALVGNVFWVGGTFLNTAGKTVPRVHVKPLRNTINGKLEVFTNGSGQGFEDCVLFWPDATSATNVANQIDANKHGNKVANYQVKRQTASGDFYLVDTEFGQAYIKADRFIEAYMHTFSEDYDLLEKYFR